MQDRRRETEEKDESRKDEKEKVSMIRHIERGKAEGKKQKGRMTELNKVGKAKKRKWA
jgi:hypothetical protein